MEISLFAIRHSLLAPRKRVSEFLDRRHPAPFAGNHPRALQDGFTASRKNPGKSAA
jgi:hypothetical protein